MPSFPYKKYFAVRGHVNLIVKFFEQTQYKVFTKINKSGVSCGSFTVPDIKTKTDTDTDKMCTEANGNLHHSLSLRSTNTCTQFCTSHIWSVSVSVSVSSSVNTPLVCEEINFTTRLPD